MPLIDTYEERIKLARDEFGALPVLQVIMDPAVAPRTLEGFLLQFCSLGVHMTKPVEGWIRSSGARCSELGYEELGAALLKHAAHEANHHNLMIADTHALAERWNSRLQPKMSASELLKAPPSDGVADYAALHEKTLSGTAPYGQIAIEYEIERVSISHGKPLLGHCVSVVGPELLDALSFVRDHVTLDEGHTRFNRKQMGAHLESYPEHLEVIVDAGFCALRAYGQFLTDCLARSEVLAEG